MAGHSADGENLMVRRRGGAPRASFAGAEETAALTAMLLGDVTSPALPAGLPVLVGSRVMDQPEIVLGGESRSCKVRPAP